MPGDFEFSTYTPSTENASQPGMASMLSSGEQMRLLASYAAVMTGGGLSFADLNGSALMILMLVFGSQVPFVHGGESPVAQSHDRWLRKAMELPIVVHFIDQIATWIERSVPLPLAKLISGVIDQIQPGTVIGNILNGGIDLWIAVFCGWGTVSLLARRPPVRT
jgi:hypothetical protein